MLANIPYESFQCLRTIRLPADSDLENKRVTRGLVVNTDAQTVLSNANPFESHIVTAWDVQTGEIIQTLDTGCSVTCLAISPDGQMAASGGMKGLPSGKLTEVIKCWDLQTGRETHAMVSPSEENKDFSFPMSIAISPDKQFVVISQSVGFKDIGKKIKYVWQISIWNLQTVQKVLSLESGWFSVPHGLSINSNRCIFINGFNIKVWNWQQQEIYTLSEKKGFLGLKWYLRELICSSAISLDSQILVTGGSKKDIKLWNLQTRKKICTLSGHSDKVTSVGISDDNQMITSCSEDGTIKIWGLP